MVSENPYVSSDIHHEPPMHRSSSEIEVELGGTRLWVLILSIIGFIIGGLTLLLGLVYGGVVGFAGAALGVDSNMGAGGGILAGGLFFLFFALSAALYIVPSYFLYKYASAIGQISRRGQPAIVEALSSQRKFWKILVLGMLCFILLYLLLIVLLFAFGIAGGLLSGSI